MQLYFYWDRAQGHWVFGRTLLLSCIPPLSASVLDMVSEPASVWSGPRWPPARSHHLTSTRFPAGHRAHVFIVLVFFERVLLYNSGWLQNYYVAQASLKLGFA